jgi:tRNA-binding EMAP/Myf-like protein
MKFTLSWLKDHLDTEASATEVVAAMTMAGLEVEHVTDPATKLASFTVAKIVEAVQHPNADRLRVCQVDTVDGRKEIVCGAPNARPGLTTVYAPIGAYVPGLGVTLVEKPVRGVVSNGMLCSGSELEADDGSEGILELSNDLAVGTPASQALGLEAVIDFEVTPNRPDWLGVAGIARDLAAAGVGTLKDLSIAPVPGTFPCPIAIKVDGETCPVFAGRLIKGVKNGPSPKWLADRLKAIGLRPINILVDITNLISYDRARPLHVYDAAKLVGTVIEARLGHGRAEVTPGDQPSPAEHHDEQLIALDGKTYDITPEMSVIADADGNRPIGLGGVMGGESTGCSDDTVDVFVESAWFEPIRTAQTGRVTGINSDAQYRFARTVDTGSLVPGLELATRLILGLCGGEASEVVVAGEAPAAPGPILFDPAYVGQLSGLEIAPERSLEDPDRPGLRHRAADRRLDGAVRHPRREPGLRDPADLPPRRAGQGRPGRGSGPHRRLRRPALHSAARNGAGGRRRADRAPGPGPDRPPRPGGGRLQRGGDLELHQPEDRGPVRRRRGRAGAGQSDRLGAGLHAPVDPAQPDRGGRPQRPPGLPGRRPVRGRPGVLRRPPAGPEDHDRRHPGSPRPARLGQGRRPRTCSR